MDTAQKGTCPAGAFLSGDLDTLDASVSEVSEDDSLSLQQHIVTFLNRKTIALMLRNISYELENLRIF